MEEPQNPTKSHLVAPDWKDPVTHAKRAFQPDFAAGIASPAERAAMPKLAAQAQDYLAWRRSTLLLSVVLLGITAIISVVNFAISAEQNDAQRGANFDSELVNGIIATGATAKCFLAIMVFLAWKHWNDLPRTHRRVKLGWIVGFLVPFVIALVPFTEILKLGGQIDQLPQEQKLGVQMLGLMFGLVSFLQLLPAILSIFVGALRAALFSTRFLPESSIPGWVVGIAAPVLSLLLLAVFVLINQIAGNTLLLIGFGLVIANFLLYARFGPRLARSFRREELEREFGSLRMQSRIMLGAGATCILIALFSTEIMGMKLVGVGERKLFSILQFIEIVIELVGKSTITMLLFSDLLMSAIRHARESSKTFAGTELATALDGRLLELEQAGARSIGELGRFRTGSGD